MFLLNAKTRKYYDDETGEAFALSWKHVRCTKKTTREQIIIDMVMPPDSKVVRYPGDGYQYIVAGWWRKQ